jgi:glycosyltransferase involved in cell wall biosynthesis
MHKIFVFPSHSTPERTSGVDFARVIQPMEYLGKLDDFQVRIYDAKKDTAMDWQWVTKNHDAIFFNYTASPWEFAKMGLMARKAGIPMIMDVDDSLWDIMPDNPVYNSFKRGSDNIRNFTAICNEVDYMTTTSKYLRNVIANNTKKTTEKIKVFPNYIDLDNMYKHRCPFKDDQNIRLAHFGSTTHFIDLQDEEFMNGIDMVMKEFPNVTLQTVGAMIPKYRYKWGFRYENSFGHQDVYKWASTRLPPLANEWDIIVTPLSENRYTKCKSFIKFLESSSLMKPGVWQKIRQYEEVVDNGKNGFLAMYAEDWYLSIKALIEDKQLRQDIAKNAYNTVQEHWQIKDNVDKYAVFMREILT